MSFAVFAGLLAAPQAKAGDPPTVAGAIPDLTFAASGSSAIINAKSIFHDPNIAGSVVRFSFALTGASALLSGTQELNFVLDDATAPATVKNFLHYVNSGAYDYSFIHYTSPGFIMQGGGFAFGSYGIDRSPYLVRIASLPPVANEYSASRPNVRGSIAMAKTPNSLNSATAGWFINLEDNSDYLSKQNGGYAVFGNVAGNGLALIDALASVPYYNETSFNASFTQLPLINYFPGDEITIPEFLLIQSARVVSSLKLSAASSDPSVFAFLDADNDNARFVIGKPGPAHITLAATNLDGQSSTVDFSVTIARADSFNSGVFAFTASDWRVNDSQQVGATIVRTGNIKNAATVTVKAIDESAIRGTDYTLPGSAVSGGAITVKFAPGQATQTIAVAAAKTLTVNKKLVLQIVKTSPGSGLGAPNATAVTLCNLNHNPVGSFQFSQPSMTVSGTQKSVSFTVIRTGATGEAVVNYGEFDGTAKTIADYSEKIGALDFPASVKKRTFSIPLVPHTNKNRPPLSFTVALANPVGGASLGAISTIKVTIVH